MRTSAVKRGWSITKDLLCPVRDTRCALRTPTASPLLSGGCCTTAGPSPLCSHTDRRRGAGCLSTATFSKPSERWTNMNCGGSTSLPKLGSRVAVWTCRDPVRRSSSENNWCGVGRTVVLGALTDPIGTHTGPRTGNVGRVTLANSRMFLRRWGPPEATILTWEADNE